MNPNTAQILLEAYLRNSLCNLNQVEKEALLLLIKDSKELRAYKQVSLP